MGMNVRRLAALSGLLAALVTPGLLTAATLLSPRYSTTHQSLSDLTRAEMPYSALARTALMLFGALLLPFALAAHRVGRPSAWANWVAAALVIAGLLEIVSGSFPDDSEQTVALGVKANTIHDISANAGAGMLGFAAVLATGMTWGRPGWHGFRWFSLAAGMLGGLGWATFEYFTPPKPVGIFQRVGLGTLMLWLAVFSVKIQKRASGT